MDIKYGYMDIYLKYENGPEDMFHNVSFGYVWTEKWLVTSFLFLLVHSEYSDQAFISIKGNCKALFCFVLKFYFGFLLVFWNCKKKIPFGG